MDIITIARTKESLEKEKMEFSIMGLTEEAIEKKTEFYNKMGQESIVGIISTEAMGINNYFDFNYITFVPVEYTEEYTVGNLENYLQHDYELRYASLGKLAEDWKILSILCGYAPVIQVTRRHKRNNDRVSSFEFGKRYEFHITRTFMADIGRTDEFAAEFKTQKMKEYPEIEITDETEVWILQDNDIAIHYLTKEEIKYDWKILNGWLPGDKPKRK